MNKSISCGIEKSLANLIENLYRYKFAQMPLVEFPHQPCLRQVALPRFIVH
jgi:hypothetical protein